MSATIGGTAPLLCAADLDIPTNSVIFILGGDEQLSMAYVGDPGVDDRLRADAIYRLMTATSMDPKKMGTAVIRGLAMLNSQLH